MVEACPTLTLIGKEGVNKGKCSREDCHRPDGSERGGGAWRGSPPPKEKCDRGTQVPSGERKNSQGSSHQRWLSESYAVREKYCQKICKRWGMTPTVDAFASKDNARCPMWWGEGSPWGTDAFQQSWKGHFLWPNPLFSVLPQVVAKLKADKAHGVLVVPDWRRRVWHKHALTLKLASLRFPTGTRLFELGGKPCKGTLWPTRAIFVCGHDPLCPSLGYESGTVLRDLRKVRFTLKPVIIPPPISVKKMWKFCE